MPNPKSSSSSSTLTPTSPATPTTPGSPSSNALSPMAIIGMGCRFPGDATSPSKFWDMLSNARDAWSEWPADRFNKDAFYHPHGGRYGSINVKGGYFLTQDISHFDTNFFNINEEEAKAIDPQHRLHLENAYEALESAGIPMETLIGSKTSVYISSFNQDYHQILQHDKDNLPRYTSTGTGTSCAANRISYFFDLKGPSMTVDTACSGSLVALHLACESLRNGESEIAIVGGSNVMLGPNAAVMMAPLKFHSPDGRCFSYDSRASGYARGEGVATLILKPLSTALRDGDPIRAVIRGTGVNSDGRTAGLTTPSQSAQECLMRQVYERAALDPLETIFVEGHGTGTQAGDPIEAGALAAVFGKGRDKNKKLWLGSVKTNVGHLEGASGLAGVMKAVLMVERGEIVPNLNFVKANPRIDMEEWKIRVPIGTKSIMWPAGEVRRISVNSFGFGGTNGHAIVESAQQYLLPHPFIDLSIQNAFPSTSLESGSVDLGGTNDYTTPKVFVLSTHYRDGTISAMDQLAKYLEESPAPTYLSDLAHTLAQHRSRLSWRAAVIASSVPELIQALQDKRKQIVRSSTPPRVGFVFTGQGANWHAMGRSLIEAYPVFRRSLETAERHLKNLGAEWSLMDELGKDARNTRVNDSLLSHPLSTAIQIALVDLLSAWGVQPRAVIGHSSGEIAAAYAAGAVTLETAMTVSYLRGVSSLKAKEKTPELRGAMLAVGLSQDETESYFQALKPAGGKVVIGCINSPSSVTVSGDEVAIDELQETLESKGVSTRRLKVETAYHSHHMTAASEQYGRLLETLETQDSFGPEVTYWSSVTAARLTHPSELDASYWVEHMVAPVRFSQALQAMCTAQEEDSIMEKPYSVDILVEIGPHKALSGPIRQILDKLRAGGQSGETQTPHITYVPTLTRNSNDVGALLETAATLFCRGTSINFDIVNFPKSNFPQKILTDLPLYPWNHTVSHWYETRLSKNYRFRKFPRHELLGNLVPDFNELEPRWRNVLRLSEVPWMKHHNVQDVVLFPGAGYISMAIEAALQFAYLTDQINVKGFRLRDLSFHKALVVADTAEGVEISFALRPNENEAVGVWNEFRVFSYQDNGMAIEHCRGLISLEVEAAAPEVGGHAEEVKAAETRNKHRFELAEKTCNHSLEVKALYDIMDGVGLHFGEKFKNLQSIKYSSAEAVATIIAPDTAECTPGNFEYPHVIHTTTLDAVMQLIFPLMDAKLGLPRRIKEFYVSRHINNTAGHYFRAHAVAAAKHDISVMVVDPALGSDAEIYGEPVIEMKHFNLAIISNDSEKRHSEVKNGGAEQYDKVCSKLLWDLDVDFIRREDGIKLWGQESDIKASSAIAELDRVSLYYIQDALESLRPGEEANMEGHLRKFYKWMQRVVEQASEMKLDRQSEDWLSVTAEQRKDFCASVTSKSEFIDAPMVAQIGTNLAGILRKEVEPLQLMLEDNLLYRYYREQVGLARTVSQMSGYLQKLIYKRPDISILEIGAGTGGTTLPIMQVLGGGNTQKPRSFSHYTFTDISSGFFVKAKDNLKPWGDLVTFKTLDIEVDPKEQGFEYQQYDVIIAANVLHATSNMRQTLAHVKKLLKPGGRLLLQEITHPPLCGSIVFGTLSGWWRGELDGREWTPTLTDEQWKTLLQETGFSGLDHCLWDYPEKLDHICSAIVSTALETDIAGHPTLTTKIVYEESTMQLAAKLNSSLESLTGAAPDMILMRDVQSITSDPASQEGTHYVFLTGPTNTSVRRYQFEGLHAVLRGCPGGILWISRGGQMDSTLPDSAWIHGCARVARSENPSLNFAILDLDPRRSLDLSEHIATSAETIIRVFNTTFMGHREQPRTQVMSNDVEFVERESKIFIPRYTDDEKLNSEIVQQHNRDGSMVEETEPWPFNQTCGSPLALEIGTAGVLDSLHFVEDPDLSDPNNPLPDDWVELEVRAIGINFRDIMISMGQIGGDDIDLGSEASGIIVRVGKNVTHLKSGDRACTWASRAYTNLLRAHGAVTQPIPDAMSFEEAAAIPIVWCTAYASLYEAARLQPGEKVLIHSASGAVGQAALTLARLRGAEIFATVGSAKKKALIMEHHGIPADHIFSSSDTSFAAGVMRMTNNKGVDVALNSLSGEFLRQTWNCIAPFGRFIEIGKRDMTNGGRLDMAPFLEQKMFASVNLSQIYKERMEQASKLLQATMRMFHDGIINHRTIHPLTVYPISKAEEAFRLMQGRKHLGKLVLKPEADCRIKVRRKISKPPQKCFREDATYLMVGGLGGMGRWLAQWMSETGARHLAFLSRSGLDNPNAAQLVDKLTAQGVIVKIFKCDAGDTRQLADAIYTVAATMPPIRGVIHGGMVLKDMTLDRMDYRNFQVALHPKIKATWNLHNQLAHAPLDFFIMLSSTTAVVGNLGQSNYAAGCSFQDAFAHFRRHRGLPAFSLNLTAVEEAGYIADNASIRETLLGRGYYHIRMEQVTGILQAAILYPETPCQIVTGLYGGLTRVRREGTEQGPKWLEQPSMWQLKMNTISIATAITAQQDLKQSGNLLCNVTSLKEAVYTVCKCLMKKLSSFLSLPEDEIDPSRSMSSYGVDSLVAIELRNWLLKEMKADMRLFEINGYASITALSEKIAMRSQLLPKTILDARNPPEIAGNPAEQKAKQEQLPMAALSLLFDE
ncbi:putative polyketide synthase [Tirmania nivea]|nr:putative polyketide synthase [Tirmania nivea]